MPGVRLMIQFTAESAQQADTEIEALKGRCLKAQSEAGCNQFEVFRSQLRPEHYVLLEHWASQEALDEHRKGGTGGTNPAVKREREQYEYKPGA